MMKISSKSKILYIILFMIISAFCSIFVFNNASIKRVNAEELFIIDASQITAKQGDTVEVELTLKNNPGVACLNISVDYDDDLTLTNAVINPQMGGNPMISDYVKNGSPVNIIWLSMNDYAEDDVYATLTFKVAEDAETDILHEINLSFDQDEIYNAAEDEVVLTVKNGGITIPSAVPGDINGDGKANTRDVTRLLQYIAGWDVEVSAATVDVNGDGKINTRDVTRLLQYIAGWDVEVVVNVPYTVTFNGNGGTLVSGAEKQKINKGESAVAPVYEKEGYTFDSWDVDFSNITSNLTVTAQWKEKVHEHTFSSEYTSSEEYHWHELTCECSKLDEFKDYFADKELHSYNEENHTCKCGRKQTVSLIFVDYNGRVIGCVETEYGDVVILADIINDPNRLNYIFDGWTKDQQVLDTIIVADEVIDNEELEEGIILKSVTLKASYSRAYTVIFTVDGEIIEQQLVAKGAAAVAPSLEPLKEGYIFIQWGDYTDIQNDRFVEAVFEPIKYTINYLMPDDSVIETRNNIAFDEVLDFPNVDANWFNWDEYQLYSFTKWIFDENEKWTFEDIKNEVVLQYKLNPSACPEINFKAKYNTSYNLPVIVIEEAQRNNTKINVNLSIVFPTNSEVYLYAMNLSWRYSYYLEGDDPNKGAFGRPIGDKDNAVNSEYNNKEMIFNISWFDSGNGYYSQNMQTVDIIEFSGPNSNVSLKDIQLMLLEDSALVVAFSETAEYEELQKVTPIVIYKK